MNQVFLAMVLVAFALTAWNQMRWTPPTPEEIAAAKALAEAAGKAFTDPISPMQALTNGALAAAAKAVETAIGLVGGMALFLGVMKVAEKGGLMMLIARAIRPIMVLLFPDVPPTHPAMGAMILNISANALGLGNAATPFGIRAMQQLDTLNPVKGTATNAMVLFLAINTSSVTLLPTGVMVIRERLDSADPGGIFGPTITATAIATIFAVTMAKVFQRFASPVPSPVVEAQAPVAEAVQAPAPGEPAADDEQTLAEGVPGVSPEAATLDTEFRFDGPTILHIALVLVALGLFIGSAMFYGERIGPWVVPTVIAGMLLFGWVRGVQVYSALIEGARDGFTTAVMIIPYLVAILVAVGMLRASGAEAALMSALSVPAGWIGMPPETIPMALVRSLSGSGASGVMIDTMITYGPDSLIGYIVSTIQGSSETTFYVLAVYYGSVQVQNMRHTLPVALLADLVAVLASVWAVRWYLGLF